MACGTSQGVRGTAETGGGTFPHQRTQERELEARFADLLVPVRDLTKNWEINISEYLEKYLEEIANAPITFDNGESPINFTEAALLIQGSAAVYGRKVEYLFSLVQKMAEALTHGSKGEQPGQKAAKETAGDAPARRQQDHEFVRQDDIATVDDLDALEDCPSNRARLSSSAARKHKLKRLDRTPLGLFLSDEDDKGAANQLFDLKDDLVGHKLDWKVNELHLLPSGKLQRSSRLFGDARGSVCNSPCPQEHQRGLPASSPELSIRDDDDDVPVENDFPCDSPALEDPAETLLPCDNVGAFEECPSKCEALPSTPVPCRNSVAPKVKQEKVKNDCMMVVKKLCDVMAEHPGLQKPIRVRIRARRRNTSEITETIIQLPVAEFCRQELIPFTSRILSRKGIVTPGMEDRYVQAMKTKHELELQRMKEKEQGATGTRTVDGCDLLRDGEHRGSDCDEGLEDDQTSDMPDFPDVGFPARDAFALKPSEDTVKAVDAPTKGEQLTDGESSGEPTYEDLVRARIREFHATDFKVSGLQKRVQEWEAKIRPILQEEEEGREVFDIRTYSTRVLEKFDNSSSKQTLPFQHICRGSKLWEVSRYFTASLQLANNYNVQLTQDGQLEKGMDTLKLTLLSRKQYFEELEECAAPSTKTTQPERRRKQAKRQPVRQAIDVSDVLGDALAVGLDDFDRPYGKGSSHCRSTVRRKPRSRTTASAAVDDDSASSFEASGFEEDLGTLT